MNNDSDQSSVVHTAAVRPAPSASDRIALSVIIPVYNEQESLAELYETLQEALKDFKGQWEAILVDDGSRDDSFAILKELHSRDRRFRIIRFRRNFGQTAAFSAGFDYARGRIVVAMDADLQNDPRDIPMLVDTMLAGDFDIVSGWRVHRQDAALMRKLPSRLANWLISRLTGVHLHDYGCSLKAYRSEVAKNVRIYGELHRFVPALASWMGVRIKEVPVRHHARRWGQSKYTISRTTRVILDLVTVTFLLNYAVKPMQIFGKAGLISTTAGFIIAAYLSALKIFTGAALSQRPLLFLAVLLIIVGVQFITMGLLGELIVRTYYEVQNKPTYMIREITDV
jgi:glycosyltransferase involved in cell wall biosynthesis